MNISSQETEKVNETAAGDDAKSLPKLQTHSIPCAIHSEDSPAQVKLGKDA